jgi:hypothetical protein
MRSEDEERLASRLIPRNVLQDVCSALARYSLIKDISSAASYLWAVASISIRRAQLVGEPTGCNFVFRSMGLSLERIRTGRNERGEVLENGTHKKYGSQ